MKMEWEGGNWLMLNGVCVAVVYPLAKGKWCAATTLTHHPDDRYAVIGSFDPLEAAKAAKAAAEQAVRKWFRECLGEPVGNVYVQPHREGSHDRVFCWAANPITIPDRTSLYALEASDE